VIPAGTVGAAWVVYGQPDSLATVDLANPAARAGIQDRGRDQRPAGTSVANAGDVNSDGTTDLLIGAPGKPVLGRPVAGVGYLVFSRKSSATPIALATLEPVEGHVMGGPEPGSGLGTSIANAGDLNRDGTPGSRRVASAPGASCWLSSPWSAISAATIRWSSATAAWAL
jgi:FG-GAP repeat